MKDLEEGLQRGEQAVNIHHCDYVNLLWTPAHSEFAVTGLCIYPHWNESSVPIESSTQRAA